MAAGWQVTRLLLGRDSRNDISFFSPSFFFLFSLWWRPMGPSSWVQLGKRQSPVDRHCKSLWYLDLAGLQRQAQSHAYRTNHWTATPAAPTDQATRPDQARSQRQSLGLATLIGYDLSERRDNNTRQAGKAAPADPPPRGRFDPC